MSERETCAICGYHGCPGHLYYGNDCSVTFKTDNTAVIRTLEKRIAGLEAVAEAADANNVSRILIKYANFHPQWKALADALRAAGYLSE